MKKKKNPTNFPNSIIYLTLYETENFPRTWSWTVCNFNLGTKNRILLPIGEEIEIDDNADAAGLHNPNWIALFDSIKQSGKYLNRIKDLIVWCEFGNNI